MFTATVAAAVVAVAAVAADVAIDADIDAVAVVTVVAVAAVAAFAVIAAVPAIVVAVSAAAFFLYMKCMLKKWQKPVEWWITSIRSSDHITINKHVIENDTEKKRWDWLHKSIHIHL